MRTIAERRWHVVGAGALTTAILTVGAGLGPQSLVLWRGVALADTATASATVEAADVPLPELPKLAPIEHPAPRAEAIKELEARLSQLAVTKPDSPIDDDLDLGFLTDDLDRSVTAAIAQRIQELRGALDGDRAERLLEKARKAARRAKRKANEDDREVPEDDWLRFVLALEEPDEPTYGQLVAIYGMLRMLEAVGTTAAVREMIGCYSYFGELVRIDLQRAIGRLKDRAVPALIEAREHDARRVRRWASRQLDQLGRAIPGEAVSTSDPEVLADVLRAFGRTRDVDAARVVLSFCNSDEIKLREAAREAIAAIGEPAKWQLREAYDALTGDKPPRSWTWQRTGRELFRLHDRARLAIVYRQMAEGVKALAEGRHAAAATAFDKVLARSPLFPKRAEMVPAYVGLAAELRREGKREEAMAALRKALRLVPPEQDTSQVRSQLATLEAQELIEAGTPDRFLLERALELDPDNIEAKQLLASLEHRSVERQHRSQRHLVAIVVGVLALVAMVLLARRRRRAPAPAPARTAREPTPPPTPAPNGTAPEPAPTPTPASPSDERPTQEVVLVADDPNVPYLPHGASPDADVAATEPVGEPPGSDALPTQQPDELPGSDAAPTQQLDEPRGSDAIPTEQADEPIESESLPTRPLEEPVDSAQSAGDDEEATDRER